MSRTWSKRTKMKPWENPNRGHQQVVSHEEFATCVRKTGAYMYESEAKKVIESLNENPRHIQQGTEHWRTYKCPFCKKWHLTSGKKTS